MPMGFMYLVAILDWYSRYVLAWRLSNTLDAAFCIEALQETLTAQEPCVFNTDQGSQFTSTEFTQRLRDQPNRPARPWLRQAMISLRLSRRRYVTKLSLRCRSASMTHNSWFIVADIDPSLLSPVPTIA